MFFSIFFALILLIALGCAICISITDFRRRIIPDAYLFPLMLSGLILTTFYSWPTNITNGVVGATFGYIMSALIGFIFDWRIRTKTPSTIPPIGMGDIKLISVGGLWLGTTGLSIALFLACVGGAIWARIKKQRYIPFAPFFIIGGILALIAIRFLL